MSYVIESNSLGVETYLKGIGRTRRRARSKACKRIERRVGRKRGVQEVKPDLDMSYSSYSIYLKIVKIYSPIMM
jgi:hypothetical protein